MIGLSHPGGRQRHWPIADGAQVPISPAPVDATRSRSWPVASSRAAVLPVMGGGGAVLKRLVWWLCVGSVLVPVSQFGEGQNFRTGMMLLMDLPR
jgi:hypothetical protein